MLLATITRTRLSSQEFTNNINTQNKKAMYIIIDREKLPQDRHYELMPDGRAIVSGNEAKMMDTLEGVTVVQTTAQLEALRNKLKSNQKK